jgi:copper chaperone CopZ
MQRATLHIEGMSCGHCLNAVNRALSAVPGVRIDSIRIGRTDVSYEEDSVALTELEAAVGEAGYRATARSTTS